MKDCLLRHVCTSLGVVEHDPILDRPTHEREEESFEKLLGIFRVQDFHGTEKFPQLGTH
jgi:hypothetical protein